METLDIAAEAARMREQLDTLIDQQNDAENAGAGRTVGDALRKAREALKEIANGE